MAEPSATPVFDAVDGWPLPEAQTEWLGAPDAERRLAAAYAGKRMHHAWIFGGAKGIGKATLAFRFARWILANPDPAGAVAETLALPEDHRVARQVAAGAHPNLLVLRRPWDETGKRFRTELTVGEVRRIQRFFGSTAGEAGWRICIIDSADDLNASAENALLKMLEEPPERGLFLLVANRPGQLLPTTRSRCGRLNLKPLDTAAVRKALLARQPTLAEEEAEIAARLSGGSLRRAIAALETDSVGVYRSFGEITATLPEIDYGKVHDFADSVAVRGRDADFDGFVHIVEDWLDRRIRGVEEPSAALPPAVAGASLASWAGVWENLRESSLQAEALNLDRRQVVLQVFMALADATRM